MAFLASKPLYFCDRNTRDADFVQRLAYIIELERFNDCCDQLHGTLLYGIARY